MRRKYGRDMHLIIAIRPAHRDPSTPAVAPTRPPSSSHTRASFALFFLLRRCFYVIPASRNHSSPCAASFASNGRTAVLVQLCHSLSGIQKQPRLIDDAC